jgi:hypothetical protein
LQAVFVSISAERSERLFRINDTLVPTLRRHFH